MLFDPANFFLLSLHFVEAAVVFEHFELLAVSDQCYAFADRSDAIVEIDLPHRYIYVIVLFVTQALAGGGENGDKEQHNKTRVMKMPYWSA